ncbi:hypothetical protein L1987_53000 [Smallanthus sonchifolius]|uniref:Uncharacterized protein n=1 Tax=Smallanthus sonchifolius TaxID=185202 RepID=A0ACB9EVA7_9ASTR|nr:hypothetical protein L1987_53000 [Smallanthus sonchifolius]
MISFNQNTGPRETPLDVSLLGSGSLPGSIEHPPELFLSLLNLSVEEPDQDDVPSPTTTILEVLIDLASNTPNPSSSTLKVHSRSYERMDVEEAVTTAGPSNNQEDSDNIAKTSTTATHSEDASLETPLTERNPRCQETMGDGDEEARPKAPSGSKDSTTMDEDRLQLHILELTVRVAMLEAEVSKLRHEVSMHEANQCLTLPTPSLLPDSDLRRMMELGESSEPENEGGRHLLLAIRHYFNPRKNEIIDAKPRQSHSPFISWSYNAEKNEFTLTDVKGQKMRCSSKAIFKMASKYIKTLSELPLNNPSMDQRGYEVERIVRNMQKLQQQRQ